ncbi:MAG: hypothetical protein AB197_00315 [Parcubacteria bacterium C7867-002]|nr:MAG: hypothetical protein AB197_00315 [Parcubacteria bacterium C7867-002]
MKKSGYWITLRQKLAFPYTNTERRDVHDEGLAEYAYRFWKANGSLPDNYLPIPEKEEGRPSGVLRRMWDIVEQDPSFKEVVLDVYLQHGSKEGWSAIKHHPSDMWRSRVVAPQLREIAQNAVKTDPGYTLGKDSQEKVTGLLFLCLEYVELKWAATKHGDESYSAALFKNVDLASLIFDHSAWNVKEVEETLERFERVRTLHATSPTSPEGEDKKCFNEDIRPILIGRLMSEAKTFASWQKIFTLTKDERTKTFALYHMSDKAKSINQVVRLHQDACKFGFASIMESAKLSWMELCSKMSPEELFKLPLELQLDQQFVEDQILKKCED